MSVRGGVAAEVAGVVRKCLERGFPVEIEGLGTFRIEGSGRIEFAAETRPKVFIAYVEEDYRSAERLYDALEAAGYQSWLDKKKLLPGQNWPRSIERAIEVSDFFIGCFSRQAIGKRGYFHSELRYAIDCASRLPLGEIYLVPARLDDCEVPPQIARHLQYVDLFPDWEKGVARIMAALRRPSRERQSRAA